MNFRAAKWLAMSLVTVSAFAIASASTEAEACCGLWQCLFGWCGGCRPACSPCGPSMGGCGPAGCPTTSYYGPVVYRGCAPCASGCSPCATGCSPCGIASNGCATGDCALGSSSSSQPPAPAPEPNDNWKNKKGKIDTYMKDNSSDSDMGKRDNGALKKARTGEENDAGDNQGSAAPVKSEGGTQKASKKGPAAPKAGDGDAQDDSSRAPTTISVDEKVAWRNAPARTHVESRTRTVSARIVRIPAYPKSDWLPVEDDSKVAKK